LNAKHLTPTKLRHFGPWIVVLLPLRRLLEDISSLMGCQRVELSSAVSGVEGDCGLVELTYAERVIGAEERKRSGWTYLIPARIARYRVYRVVRGICGDKG